MLKFSVPKALRNSALFVVGIQLMFLLAACQDTTTTSPSTTSELTSSADLTQPSESSVQSEMPSSPETVPTSSQTSEPSVSTDPSDTDILTPPGEWTDIDDQMALLFRHPDAPYSIYRTTADIEFKDKDTDYYLLVEHGEDEQIRWLANGEYPASPFYSLQVNYIDEQTFVWGIVKDEALTGEETPHEVDLDYVILFVDGEEIRAEIHDDAYLFIVDGYKLPDKLNFYNEAGELQGGTANEPSGVDFSTMPQPPSN